MFILSVHVTVERKYGNIILQGLKIVFSFALPKNMLLELKSRIIRNFVIILE